MRRQRKDFELLLAGVLERGERDRQFRFADRDLALRALLDWDEVPVRGGEIDRR